MNGLARTLKTTIAEKAVLSGVLCLLTAFLAISCTQETVSTTAESKGFELGQIPIGERGAQYANLNTSEMLPVGPSGIFAVKNGYAVPNSVSGTVIVLNADFKVQRTIDVSTEARNIVSVVQDGEDLVALDDASMPPKLLRIAPQGTIKSISIPEKADALPTGLKHDDNGLVLDYGGGEVLYRVTDHGSSADLVLTEGYVWNGITFSVEAMSDSNHHERLVKVGQNTGFVRVPNYIGTVQILGSDGSDGVRVFVEDVTMTEKISVEQSVWHLDSKGQVVSVALVPMEERKVAVNQGIALDNKGEPVVMVTKLDALEFWGLEEHSPSLILDRTSVDSTSGSIPTVSDKIGVTQSALTTYGGSCLTSSQMQSNAEEYLSVSQLMSSNNINSNGTCTTRTKPNYLGSPGFYSSVSYDWGGWDTPSAFQSAMSAGGKAGNLNTAGGLSCSYGVDCSGFLTRVWGFTDWKRSTNDVPNANTSKGPSYGPGYFVGDAFNKVGVHVVLYAGYAPNGLYLWEAAGEPYARAVYRFSSWSYLSGYESWRSSSSCN